LLPSATGQGENRKRETRIVDGNNISLIGGAKATLASKAKRAVYSLHPTGRQIAASSWEARHQHM